MSRSAVSLGDLLRILAQAGPGHAEAAARAAGYVRVQGGAAAPTVPTLAVHGRDDGDDMPAAALPTAPADAGHPAPLFWRIASDLSDEAPAGEPTWLAAHRSATAQVTQSDPAQPLPRTAPLLAPPRLAALLRRTMAREQVSRDPDLSRLTRALAERRALTRLPLAWRPRWPSRVQLVFDTGHALRPLQDDLLPMLAQLQRTLGARARVLIADGDPQALRDVRGEPAGLPADGATVVVLGDAGLYQPGGAAHRRWLALGLRLQRNGPRPLLLAPVPRRRVDAATIDAFDVVPFDDGAAPRPLVRTRAGATGGTTEPGLVALRAALFGSAFVDAPLLRRLRRALRALGQPVDIGSEVAVWHDAAVSAGLGACTLQPERRAEVAADWRLLDAPTRERIAAEHWQTLQARSPLVRAEYALWLQGGTPAGGAMADVLRGGAAAAEQLMRDMVALQRRPGEAAAPAIAAFMGRFEQRSPELLAAGSDALQAAWAIAHEDRLRKSGELPAGLRSAAVAWVLQEDIDDAPLELCIEGRAERASQLTVARAAAVQAPSPTRLATLLGGQHWALTAWPAPPARLAATLARWREAAKGAGWQPIVSGLMQLPLLPLTLTAMKSAGEPLVTALRQLQAGDAKALVTERVVLELRGWLASLAERQDGGPIDDAALLDFLTEAMPAHLRPPAAPPAARPRQLRVGAAVELDPGCRQRVEVARRTIELEAVPKPDWAVAIERDGEAMFATLGDGRRLRWVPRMRLALADRLGRGTGESFELPQGCWWDAAQHDSLFGESDARVLRQPAWASACGIDARGCWADLRVSQTLAPGSFPAHDYLYDVDLGQVVMRLRFIPPGHFWMGSPQAEAGRDASEVLHPVTLTHGFWLAEYACNEAWFRSITGTAYAPAVADEPATQLSADDVLMHFVPGLRRSCPGLPALVGLPTEAQWEYAMRAGGHATHVFDFSFFAELVNRYGLRCSAPPVWEWCADGHGHFAEGEAVDPLWRGDSDVRVTRGGSPRVAARDHFRAGDRSPTIGFRLMIELGPALEAEPPEAPRSRAKVRKTSPAVARRPGLGPRKYDGRKVLKK